MGLLAIENTGAIKILSTGTDNETYGCLNDLDVAADGTIYFTEASHKYPMLKFSYDILEHQPNGRLLAYNPKTQTTRTVLNGIHFANGVAVSPDQSFVLVVETGMYRVLRVWLNGPKAGQSDVFIDNLPGFPDGISSNGKDRFWLALVTPRDEVLDTKLLPSPFLRKVVVRLPKFLQPAPKRYSFVLGLDSEGKVVDNLQNGAADCYAEISNAIERNRVLYFGSIGESTVGKYALRDLNSRSQISQCYVDQVSPSLSLTGQNRSSQYAESIKFTSLDPSRTWLFEIWIGDLQSQRVKR
jgi:hypothetical protein